MSALEHDDDHNTEGLFSLRSLLPSIDLDQGDEVTCLEAWNEFIYLGTRLGNVLHYFHDETTGGYLFASCQKLHHKGTRTIRQIIILPQVNRVAILSCSTLSFFSLPELTPQNIGRIRDVQFVCLDLNNNNNNNKAAATPEKSKEVRLTVLTKTVIRIVRVLNSQLRLFRDVEYPGALVGVQRSSLILLANNQSYELVDLVNTQKIPLLPISGGADENSSLPPHVASVNDHEFMVVSSGSNSCLDPAMGLVVNLDGDICRGTIPWPHYPSSVAVDDPYVAAVFTNEMPRLQLHSLQDQTLLQEFVLPKQSEPEEITDNPESSKDVPADPPVVEEMTAEESENQVTLPSDDDKKDENNNNNDDDTSDKQGNDKSAQSDNNQTQDLTPSVQTETKPQILNQPKVVRVSTSFKNYSPELEQRLTFVPLFTDRGDNKKRQDDEEKTARSLSIKSSLPFVIFSGGVSGVQCLEIQPFCVSLDGCLVRGEFDKVKKKMEEMLDSITTELMFNQFAYIRQKIPFALLKYNRWSEAEFYWHETETDPRLVISVYNICPVYGNLWLYRGIKSFIETELGDFSQHRTPETDAVLKVYLASRLQKRNTSIKNNNRDQDELDISKSIEIAYLHLLLDSPTKSASTELYEFLDDNIFDSYQQSLDLLLMHNKFYATSKLYQKLNQYDKVLETWQKILIDEASSDDDEEVSYNKFATYLGQCKHQPALIWKYGSWLLKEKPLVAVKVLVDKSLELDPVKVKDLIFSAGGEAWTLYLENEVFVDNDESYLNELISVYANELIKAVSENSEFKSEIIKSYANYRDLLSPKIKYIDFLHSWRDQSVDKRAFDLRIKLLKILERKQGSYNAQDLMDCLEPYENIFIVEMVIIYSRLRIHQKALHLLVQALSDYDAAIHYCVHEGNSVYVSPVDKQEEEEEDDDITNKDNNNDLFRLLLIEFLKIQNPTERVECVQRLLNGYATDLHLDTVLSNVPSSWSFEILSEFALTSLRGIIGQEREMLLLKGAARGRAFRISSAWVDQLDKLRISNQKK